MNYKKFVHLDSQVNPWGIVSVQQMCGELYDLKYNKPENKLKPTDWMLLFSEAKTQALQFGADTIAIRIRREYEPKVFQGILAELEFKKIGDRIEYQCDIKNLPYDHDTPFRWHTASELGWNSNSISQFTEQIIRGTLDVDVDESAENFIQDWLQHDEFTFGTDCISIGFIGDRPVAIVVVQVESKSGWSRISYMGLLPQFRGKGLGKWVHRRGFQMIRKQKGTLYHGGTHLNNFAMRKLFEQHRCNFYCEMEEWGFKPERRSSNE